ncbi:Uu.00g032870.m01.CDS01 [Anthostomella pinea]|uniref:Uu.00g032870.m01.CDS01 n=1 Tax=Anthostomella pinea TaxID=933095 RepID=A0AAI8V8S1_9PEZI|nr:Uu.00g032870.m01.CDS01 [Anthostomella pinea]
MLRRRARNHALQQPSTVMHAADDHLPWYKDAGMWKMMLLMVMIYLTQVCTGYDATLTSNLQSFTRWKEDMGSPTSSQLGLISAIYFIGCLCGSIPAALLTDRFGRKWGLAAGQFLTIVGVGFQAGSHGRGQYMGSRFILGFGIAFVTCAGPTFLSELAHSRMRGTLVSFFNPFWYLGSIIAAWTCFGTSFMAATDHWAWRIPSLLQALFPCLVLPCIYFAPESPRWLVSRGRKADAEAVLAKYHGNGDRKHPVVVAQLAEIELALNQAQEGITWKALLTRKPNLHRLSIVVTMTLMALWCGQNIITYYFSPILKSVGITGTTRHDQRRPQHSQPHLLAHRGHAFRPHGLPQALDDVLRRDDRFFVPFIALSAVYAQTTKASYGYGVVVCLFCFDIMYNVACNPLLYSYPTEIMPFFMRSRGLAVKNLVGQVALIINMYVNPIALASIEWRYYFVFLVLDCCWLAGIYFGFPETKGYSLEELSSLFEATPAVVLLGQKVGDDGEVDAEMVTHTVKAKGTKE